jgi:hypothetical protein
VNLRSGARIPGRSRFALYLGRSVAVLGVAVSARVAGADPPYPVTLSVVGSGKPVRVFVTSRSLAGGKHSLSACDDGTDVSILFDRVVAAGQAFAFDSPRECVCYQQGHGTFRQTDLLRARDRCADRSRRVGVAVDTNL